MERVILFCLSNKKSILADFRDFGTILFFLVILYLIKSYSGRHAALFDKLTIGSIFGEICRRVSKQSEPTYENAQKHFFSFFVGSKSMITKNEKSLKMSNDDVDHVSLKRNVRVELSTIASKIAIFIFPHLSRANLFFVPRISCYQRGRRVRRALNSRTGYLNTSRTHPYLTQCRFFWRNKSSGLYNEEGEWGMRLR